MFRWHEAEAALLRATRAGPTTTTPAAHANLGILYHRWRRYSAAAVAYRTALALDPKLANIREHLADVMRLLNVTKF